MDLFQSFYVHGKDSVGQMPPEIFWTFVRLLFALTIATAGCAISKAKFYQRIPDGVLIGIQFFITLLSWLTTLELPISLLPLTLSVKFWIFCISFFGILTLPLALSCLLTPVVKLKLG